LRSRKRTPKSCAHSRTRIHTVLRTKNRLTKHYLLHRRGTSCARKFKGDYHGASHHFQWDPLRLPCTSRSSAHASAQGLRHCIRSFPGSCTCTVAAPRAFLLSSSANCSFHEAYANQGQTVLHLLFESRPGGQGVLLDDTDSAGLAGQCHRCSLAMHGALKRLVFAWKCSSGVQTLNTI
jgi:hypothetical protein